MKGNRILLLATLLFAFLHHLVCGEEFTQNHLNVIKDLITAAHITLEDFAFLNDEIDYLVGKSPEVIGDEADLDSLLQRLNYAYHIGYPADPDYWGSAYIHMMDEYFVPIKKVREAQKVWIDIKSFGKVCNQALDKKKAERENAITPEIDQILRECSNPNATVPKFIESNITADESPLRDVQNVARLHAVFIVASQYNFMFFVGDKYGFEDVGLVDTYQVRLSPIDRMADEANLDHYEITRRIQEFQQRIDDPTAKLSPIERIYNQARLDEIKEELQNPPFDWIYSNGDDGPVEFRRDCNLHLRQEFEGNFEDLFKWISPDSSLAEEWLSDVKQVISWIDWKEDGAFEHIKDLTIQFYKTYFHIEYNSTTKEWIWDWDAQNADTCAKFVRDSWERLDKIVEKLKCYMKDSYYFSKDVRKRALQLTQLELTETRLFSNISTTLFKPCRITDDRDLVSTCTRENHEICAPMFFYRDVGQDPAFNTLGGISLLRPKAYYRFNDTSKKCEAVNTYIVPYKMCQCGFRTDCGNDLGGNLTCRLSADFLRKQCRGTTAYPCKSLPLAPGRHHESCLSGYCDLKMNSCEDGPPLVLQKSSRGYDFKINHWPITVSIISVILNLKIQNG